MYQYQETIQILISDSSGYFSSPELLVSMFWPFLDKKWLYWQLQCVVFFFFFHIHHCFFCRIGLLVLDDTLRSCLWASLIEHLGGQRLWSRASQWWKWGNYKHAFSCSPPKIICCCRDRVYEVFLPFLTTTVNFPFQTCFIQMSNLQPDSVIAVIRSSWIWIVNTLLWWFNSIGLEQQSVGHIVFGDILNDFICMS